MTILKTHPSGFKEKAKEELIKAFQLTIYFAVWFCSLAFLAAVLLEERPIPLSIFGFAFIKAAICAKFMILAQVAYPIQVNKNNGIVNSLLRESVFYLFVVIVLSYIEAGVVGLFNGKSFLISMTDFGKHDPLRILALSIVYWLIVWPFLVFTGFKLAIGSTATLELLFGKKKSST